MANKKKQVAYGNARFNYTNDIGRSKSLMVYGADKQDDKYCCVIWDNTTGEYCGSGYKTKEEITEFLAHYGIKNPDLSGLEITYS
jgi:hypothetical protein